MTMLDFGPLVDYSFQHPPIADILAAGYTDVCRYFCPPGTGQGKELTAAERDALHAAGLGIVPNWEWFQSRPDEGPAAGAADGAEFARQMRALGFPDGSVGYVSYDKAAGDYAVYSAYYSAARAQMNAAGYQLQGGYMGSVAGHALLNAGIIDFFWQASAMSWSVGWADSPRANFIQRWGGVLHGAADHNDRITRYVGAWRPQGVDYLITHPAVSVEDDDMPTVNIRPGEAATVPVPLPYLKGYGGPGADLYVTTDNPSGKGASQADLRVAIQTSTSPPGWEPVPVWAKNTDPFVTACQLGMSGTELQDTAYCVSVSNIGALPVTVTVAQHPKGY